MSGFSFTTGQHTVTHTTYCPGCLRRYELSHVEYQAYEEEQVPPILLYCSVPCQARFLERLVAKAQSLRRRISASERDSLLNGYIEQDLSLDLQRTLVSRQEVKEFLWKFK